MNTSTVSNKAIPCAVTDRGDAIVRQYAATLRRVIERGLVDGAIVLVEHANVVTGPRPEIADWLDRFDYDRQTRLLRAHDARIGVPLIIIFADGHILFSVLVRGSWGDA